MTIQYFKYRKIQKVSIFGTKKTIKKKFNIARNGNCKNKYKGKYIWNINETIRKNEQISKIPGINRHFQEFSQKNVTKH